MTPVFSRRAAKFDSLVEGTSTGPAHDARYGDLLTVVDVLREAPAPEPRPEFVADLRERLMAAADTLLVPSDEARLTLPARRPARERKIIAAVAGVAIVGSSASMAVAAQSALPGDALYPVKRIIEDVQAGIRVGDAQKGATLLTNAEGRLDEVRELSRTGALEDGPAIADTLNEFTEQSTEASDLLLSDYADTGDEGSIRDLRDFTSGSMQSLAELEPQVPIEARDELLHAAQVLSQIDTEAERACAACGGPGINQLPAILASAGYAADASAPFTGVLVPTRTDAQDGKDGKDGKQQGGKGQEQPETGQAPVSPDSLPALPGTGGGSGSANPDTSDPIKTLTEGLLGTGDGSQPTSNGSGSGSGSGSGQPQLPNLGEILEGVTDPLLKP